MAIAYNPRTVTDGLVLVLDAGNNKSHSTNRFISYGTGLTTQGISFQVNGDGTFQRIAAGTVIGGYEVKTTDVVYSYALGSNGCHYHGNDVSVPGGSYATFSFDYLVTGATNYPSTDYLANFENLGNTFGNSIGIANNTQNVWQRRSFTSGPSSVNGTLRMLLYPGGCGGRLADSGTLYFRNPKVEFTNVDTGNGNFSSMPNVTTWYDMSGNGNNGTLTNLPYYNMGSNNINNYINFDGTDDYIDLLNKNFAVSGNSSRSVFCWVKSSVAGNRCIISTGTPSNSQAFNLVTYGSYKLGVMGYNNDFYPSTGANIFDGNWHYVGATYDGAGTVRTYVDSVLDNTGTGYTYNTTGQNNYVGKSHHVGAEGYWSGNISLSTFYNKALTAAEVKQNFNATRARFGI